MSPRPEQLLRRYHAWEPRTDKLEFQWRARLLQSMWREAQGLAPGEYRERLRGARLAMPEAKRSLANYLTPNIRRLVRSEVEDPARSRGKLYGKPRIYDNLLSSQPLCFNLFGELSLDLELASRVLGRLTTGRIHRVTSIQFECSPGRSDARYTGDRSAFDVYIVYQSRDGGRGFAGIEVKYHEGLSEPEAEHRPRYDEIAEAMGCFSDLAAVRERPLQQVWRDHLLVGAHQQVDGFSDAFFAFLYPRENSACADVVARYTRALSEPRSFTPWTLEDVVAAIGAETDVAWVGAFEERYLSFLQIDRAGTA